MAWEKSDTHAWSVIDSPKSFQAWNKGSEPWPDPPPKNKLKAYNFLGPWVPLFKTAGFIHEANFSQKKKKKK